MCMWCSQPVCRKSFVRVVTFLEVDDVEWMRSGWEEEPSGGNLNVFLESVELNLRKYENFATGVFRVHSTR